MKLKIKLGLLAAAVFVLPAILFAAEVASPCRVDGIRSEVRCGSVKRALDPANASGVQIDVHYVVVPAVARNKKRDAIFFFAGGPGQSAIKVAPQVMGAFGKLNNWRDIVFIDQRGTGKSAPLMCKPEARVPVLREMMDIRNQQPQTLACLEKLKALPYGQLQHFNTTIAMADADAVRAALGYAQINVVGVSYGTRAVLEYLRAFPDRVRSAVIDGVAPPDMGLTESTSVDAPAAMETLLAGCETEAACKLKYPTLRRDWLALLDAPPREVRAINPATGREEPFTLDRDMLRAAVRGPLYIPALAAGVPHAVTEAAAGRFTPLVGLAAALGGATDAMAWGMHFSVVCSEDYPRIKAGNAVDSFSAMYRAICAAWPQSPIPAAFYAIPAAQFPVLVLSGGADPVTPPRHGAFAAKALGAKAKHVIVPQAGHGVMSLGCARDALAKFIDAKTETDALAVDFSCVTRIPRPTAWTQPSLGSAQ